MKIAYIANQTNSISGASNGIRMQALIWKNALECRGHIVDLINAWDIYDWTSYDVIHIFGGGNVLDFIPDLYKRNKNIVLSPIIDTDQSIFKYKLASYWGFKWARLFSSNYKLRLVKDSVKIFLARSAYEASFLKKSYDIDCNKVKCVPLSYRNEMTDNSLEKKENFCLHVSSFTQSRKNTMRLIDASIKYGFKLVLAGSFGTEDSFAPFKAKIDGNSNIDYVGFASDEKLVDLYTKAKVFALPSTYEGVGLVALEAAAFGCEIVITNIGGPKEYYADMAYLVNPYSIDEIGKAVVSAMNTGFQPKLKHFINKKYNLNYCIELLEEKYKEICEVST